MAGPFTSDRRWTFDLEPDELWAAIERTDDYRRWWPWLRRFDAKGLVGGDRWYCLVQPPLPYQVRFFIDLDRVEPGRLAEATVTGDIRGTARLTVEPVEPVEPDGHSCEARLVSSLEPAHPFFRALGVVARPMIMWGHDWVLDQGLRQFSRRALDVT